MVIIEDKGNKENQHIAKHLYFENHGIYWERYPLPVGDYILCNDAVADVITRKQKRGIDAKKMDFLGTYDVCVDTKKDMQEIVGNICGKQHARFRDECILAQNNGIKLYVLVENEDGIVSLDDVSGWHNDRLDIYIPDKTKIVGYYRSGKPRYGRKQKYPNATTGERLAKAMRTMQDKYGVTFLFTTPERSGEMILKLLGLELEETSWRRNDGWKLHKN